MGKVFISYRREDLAFTQLLQNELSRRTTGRVFIDSDIDRANWVEQLKDEIKDCNVFLLIVTEKTFAYDRISSPDDWVRQEIMLALRYERNIALVLRDNQKLPLIDNLPSDIQNILSYQGIPVYSSRLEGIDNLAKHCVAISNEALELVAIDLTDPTPSRNSALSSMNHFGKGDIIGGEGRKYELRDQSTFVEKQYNVDNRVQDAVAKLRLAREDESKLLTRRNLLNYKEKRPVSIEGLVVIATIGFIAVVVGFGVNAVVGTAIVGGILFWFFLRNSQQQQQEALRFQEINRLDEKIRKVQTQIRELEEIANTK